MSLFSKRPRSVVPPSVIGMLEAYGQAAIDARRHGAPVDDTRFGWDNFMGPVHMAMLGNDRDQVIQEIYEAAWGTAAPGTTARGTTVSERRVFGAYRLLAEFDGGLADQRFLELCDISLEYMHSMRFSSGHLTGYERDRWVATHGEVRSSFDGIVDVAVPSREDLPIARPLGLGESRLIALTAPLPSGNAFYAEHRSDGSYAVFSERPRSSDDPTRVRCDETFLGTIKDLPDLFRAVGDMFGTPPFWADDDLQPYFPARRQ
jgi:hypothetical protein